MKKYQITPRTGYSYIVEAKSIEINGSGVAIYLRGEDGQFVAIVPLDSVFLVSEAEKTKGA